MANANPGLDKIFDKEKEQRRVETVQAVVDIGMQVSDIVRTQGKIAATQAATDALKKSGPTALLVAESDWKTAHPGKTPSQDDIVQQLYQSSYNKALLDSGMGTGGALQQGLNLCQQESDDLTENDNLMKKNEIYIKMLSLSLPYIRNIQSLDKKDKGRDISCCFEAELVHNLTHTLLISDFVEHDLWFLNNQAKYYFEKCSEDISPNYTQQIKYIESLFEMVPDELKSKLQWQGP